MGRPTVIDIAREAGVSLATVDRVLNARPGVRAKTVTAVNEAISRLGYVRDIAAANLARGRSYRMAVVLPDSDSQFVETLTRAILDAADHAAASRIETRIFRFPAEDMHALAATLAAMPDDTAGVALVAPETPVVRDAVRALRARGIAVVTLVSDLPATERDHFVGIDSRAAGRTAAVLMGRFLGAAPAQVLVLAPSMLLRDAIDRRLGFDEVMQAQFPQIEVLQTLETHGRADTLAQVLAEARRHAAALRGIYLLGSGHRALHAAVTAQGLRGRLTLVGHELTPFTRELLERGEMAAVVTQNLGHLARSAFRVLRAKADRAPLDAGQEALRIEIVIRENLPADAGNIQ
jgi:LacI family transcriptional regulator